MLLKVTDLDISYGSKATVTGANIELKKGEITELNVMNLAARYENER